MTNINVSALNGRNGFVIQGTAQDGNLGDAVSGAGDINGDGLPDILIGARNVDLNGDNNSEGQFSVIFGSNDGFSGQIPVSDLNGDNGFLVNGISNQEQRLGIAVSGAGDVNGDGIDDIVIGANGTNSNSGSSYVIFGASELDSVDLLALDGTNGFEAKGIAEGDLFGGAVSSAGDVNGDGIDDIAISANRVDANGNENAGATYVIFGSDAEFPENVDLALLDGTNGFAISGANENDFSGVSLSSAGDINGDEIDDLLIGTPQADPGATENAGTTYVVFGRSGAFTPEIDLSTIDNSSFGFTINGIATGDASGVAVSAVGDVDNDGLADIGIGAFSADVGNTNAGQSYIVFGQEAGFSESVSLASLDGDNGFAINGAEVDNQLGAAISAAGDVNNDGIDDVIVSAVGAAEEAGTSYVIFGQENNTEFGATIELGDLNPNQGFMIDGIIESDRSGESVSNLGDVNGDGIDDLLIGAPQASPNGVRDAGEAYVVFGRIENIGDVDNDGSYTDQDAYLISRVAAGLDTEFAAYSGIDPLLVADVNSDGVISGLDASFIFIEANGGDCGCFLPDINQ